MIASISHADAGVVDGHDRLRARGDRGLDVSLVEAQRVRHGCRRRPARPPRTTTAFAVETKVNEGMITSSPGSIPASVNAISSAAVHEWVRNARRAPVALGEPTRAASRERAVAGEVRVPIASLHVRELLAGDVRAVEDDLLGLRHYALRATMNRELPKGIDTPWVVTARSACITPAKIRFSSGETVISWNGS